MNSITSLIRPGDRVFLPNLCGEPQTLVEAVIEDKERLRGIEIWQLNCVNPKLTPDLVNYFKFRSNGAFGNMMRIAREGKTEIIPCDHYELSRLLDEGILTFDVALIQCTPPDKHGYCSLGVAADWVLESARNTRAIVAEINDQMPKTYGNCFIHQSRFAASIHTSRPILTLESAKIGEIERKIGNFAAELVPDGATLEIGLGAIPDAVLEALKDKKDLGIHSGMITDSIVDLIETGVITNEKKTIDRGKIVTGSIAGTKRLYDLVDNNSMIFMQSVSYTHSLRVMGQIDNFIAVNSAVQIDLTGQVNSEAIGTRSPAAGAAGLTPFVLGAYESRGGKPIFALTSATRGEELSRIVPSLYGGVVTIPRSHVQYIVTEYGIANLRGKSLRERAIELIRIAHPKFRKELEAEIESQSWRYH